jgi:hypothetical protein
MLRSIFGFNWRNSEPHLLLLTKFINPKAVESLTGLDRWENVLQENATKALKRFQRDGALRPANTAEKLESAYRVSDLQRLLKERGLPPSGRKADLIHRLIVADPKGMEQSVAGKEVLVCTDKGRSVGEEYRAKEQAERHKVEQRVWDFLLAKKFKQASQAVAAYEARQVFPRGIGIDWAEYDPSRDVDLLETIFRKTPKILSQVPKEKLNSLRMAAAMMALWGTNSAKRWLPPDFMTTTPMAADVAVRMFSFYTLNLAHIKNYKQSSVVKGVQVIAADDSCPACKRLDGKKYSLESAIELPHEHCTHEMGCRCTWIAVLD